MPHVDQQVNVPPLLPGAVLTDPQDGPTDVRNRSAAPAVTLAALNPILAFGSKLLTSNFS